MDQVARRHGGTNHFLPVLFSGKRAIVSKARSGEFTEFDKNQNRVWSFVHRSTHGDSFFSPVIVHTSSVPASVICSKVSPFIPSGRMNTRARWDCTNNSP